MLDFIRPQKRFPLAVTRHALRGGAALRVAHLTDLHLEDGANAAWLKRLVRIVNAQHPDIICFTGDFACRRAQFATADVYCSILRGLRARYGKFAVTGNHDILGAAGKEPQLICRAGFTLLQNEAARVEISGQNVDILGLSTMKYDTSATAKRRFPLKGQQPGPAFRLGLVHEPAAVQLLPENWAGLILAGHTHAGQLHVPRLERLWLPKGSGPYAHGLYQTPAGPLYVSAGLGESGPRMRLCAPREVAVFNIRP